MRYRITLSYDGADFCGWQIQSGAVTVQETLEKALSALLRKPVTITGAGRTDSGVNAIGYVAHFDIKDVGALEPSELGYKLNAILPPSVVIHSLAQASPEFHARFDASSRKYTYFLHRLKDPFAAKFSLRRDWDLDFEAMNRAAALLVGRHDFACFQKTGTDVKTSICTVTEAFWAPYVPTHVSLMGFGPSAPAPAAAAKPVQATPGLREAEKGPAGECHPQPRGCPDLSRTGWRYVYFRIGADRFLRNMVRAVVGTLLEVGRGKRSAEDFAKLILPASPVPAAEGTEHVRSMPSGGPAGSLRGLAGDSVPGHALFLSKVEYPFSPPAF